MKSKITFLIAFGFMLFSSILMAQTKTVSGTVTDQEGLPLPGVNILVKGTSTGTQTDFDGNYSISASQGDVLEFSYVGFSTQNQTVGASNTLDATLEAGEALDEVIVLGYSTRDVEEVTGSSVQVGGDDITAVPMVTVDQALQGKVPGLQISQASGTPGSIQDIRVRGVSSLTAGNDPLYVIDGVPVINDNIAGSDNSSSLSPLASINSQDIASITVLKDASATAAYGARGSNGVIVITTKRGKKGVTTFDFSTSVGFQNDAYNERDVLTGQERITLAREALVNSYGANGTIGDFGFTNDNAIETAVGFNIFPAAILDYDGTDYNWDGLIKNEDALLQNYNFSASSGDENGTFYASLGYNKTEATVIGTDFERLTGAINVTRKLRDNVNFKSSINVSNTKQDPILERGTFFSNPFITRVLMNPLNNPYNADGTLNTDLNYGSLPNILYVEQNNITRNSLTRALANTSVDWNLFDNLVFSNRISLDFQLNEYKSYRNRYEGDAEDTNGDASVSDEKNYNWVYQSSLNYDFTLGDVHDFNVLALFEYQKNQNNYLFGFGENFPVDGLTEINTASANFDADSQFSDYYNVSYLGQLNYNYDNRYVADLTVRREGSSRFARGNRFGTFGSVGLAWNIHRESFMQGSIFNRLRLRGSFGVTGNNSVGLNAYQALLTYSANYADNGAGFPSQFGNPNLTWEKGETLDVGVNFGLLNNRISGSVAYYTRRTYDLLQNVPLSLTTGFSSQAQNIGEMKNSGVEFDVSVDVINSEDFQWNVSANIATVDNEVTELALGADGQPINPDAGSVYRTTEIGLPVDAWFMRTWAGVDSETGAPTWFINGRDGETTSNYNQAERVYQDASPLPTYTGGLSTRVSFKGIYADANLYFSGGNKVYEQYSQFYLRTNSFTLGTYNGASELLDRWQQPGDVTDVPRLDWASNDNFHATSSRHLYDGDFVRLRTVSVGYNLPSKFVANMGITSLNIYVRGTNLATWLKDDGLKLDPEVRADGLTRLTTPPTKSYLMGLNIKF